MEPFQVTECSYKKNVKSKMAFIQIFPSFPDQQIFLVTLYILSVSVRKQTSLCFVSLCDQMYNLYQ